MASPIQAVRVPSGQKVRFLLRLPCPPVSGLAAWGDYHFGMSLAQALRSRGHIVDADFAVASGKGKLRLAWLIRRAWLFFRLFWKRDPEVDIILRGKIRFRKRKGRPTIMWLISNSSTVSDREIEEMDHIFVASRSFAEQLAKSTTIPVSPLLQCTDSHLFSPGRRTSSLQSEYLFVGNRRDFERDAVKLAVDHGLPIRVWGRNWQGVLPDGALAGAQIENAELGAHYASARVVLNDHAPDMKRDGFNSNRIYDVLASGVPLVTDFAEELPEDLGGVVYAFHDSESFKNACAKAEEEGASDHLRRAKIAEHVRLAHSFDARAEEIEQVALNLLGKGGR